MGDSESVKYTLTHDTANAQVLPSRKKKKQEVIETETSKKKRVRKRDARGRLVEIPGKKKLSKAKRRRLEKVVDSKKKAENVS